MNAHLTQIGVCLVASVAGFTCALWATVAMRGLRQRRLVWPTRAALLAALLLFLLIDHGNDFHRHGFYNWLLFVVIALPLNLVLLGLWLWYRAMTPKRFLASFVSTGVLFVLFVAGGLAYYERVVSWGEEWGQGSGRVVWKEAEAATGACCSQMLVSASAWP